MSFNATWQSTFTKGVTLMIGLENGLAKRNNAAWKKEDLYLSHTGLESSLCM